jgi:glycine cleavage system H protein
MSENIPEGLRYTEEHEWTKTDGDVVVIGVTDHAQEQLGDVVFLELPEVGATISKGDPFGVVESVKAVSDLYAPIDGEVTAVNSDLVDAPEGINADPYGIAWLIKVKPADPSAVDALLDAAAYATLLADEAK